MFGILGCVEVTGPRGHTPPLSARHRALVAALALQPGAVVPYWRLAEALWGECPPRTAIRSLHSHVARLRLVLEKSGLGGVLQTREPGYFLDVEPAMVDAARFEAELRRVRQGLVAGEIDGAAEALERALGVWRGAALADVEPTGWMAAEAVRLENLRSAARADRCETMLALGRYGEALAEAERLLAEDPLRERLVGLHMIALWGCGRPAEAFAAYQRLREGLADELGVDPSQDLAQAHTAMLRGATAAELRPPGSVITQTITQTVTLSSSEKRPAQLPPPVGYFTGRGNELRALDETAETPGVVALICGHGGIGKTSLAVQWAQRQSGRYPDGQVFVDARGHDRSEALSAGELAGVLLRCLGVAAERVPHGLDERTGLYRSLLSGKRMLIIVDNAGGTDQIGPIVPNTATSLLLVTSRNDLAALVTHVEVRRIVLGMLTEEESTDLLRKVLGAQRVEREPKEASRLAALCGRMPLALRIAAAKLVTQPSRAIQALADEVSGDDRLAHLGVEEGKRTVEAVFATAYQALATRTQNLFRTLGQHPGPHFPAALAAVMFENPQPELDELVAAHLISETSQARYRFHDLVRIFAQGRTTEAERAEDTDRMLDWYLAIAHAAQRILDPSQDRVKPTPRRSIAAEVPQGREPILEFLEQEHDNMRAMVRFATAHGRDRAACELTYLLSSFHGARGHWAERVEMCELAVKAARRLGDPWLEAEMHRALGVVYRASYRLEEALESHMRALALMRGLDDEPGLANVYNNLGGAQVELRRFEAAVDAYEMALRLQTNAGNAFGAAAAQRNLGYVHMRMGEIEPSLAHLEQALAASRANGFQRLEASVLDSLGESHLRGEQPDRALACFRDALGVSRSIGDRRQEMDALIGLGLTHLARGEPLQAKDFLDHAREWSRSLGHRHAQARVLNHLAEAHLALGHHDAARRCLDESAQLRESVPDPFEEACLRRTLGGLALALGDKASARQHWERAIALFHKANAEDEARRIEAGPLMTPELSRAAG